MRPGNDYFDRINTINGINEVFFRISYLAPEYYQLAIAAPAPSRGRAAERAEETKRAALADLAGRFEAGAEP